MNKKDNGKQVVSAYEIVFDGGRENGKRGVLVTVGELEVLFNKTNALDIYWVKYKGINVSFLSKNGLNSNDGEFARRFEGGFLYTCGADNVSSCVEGKPVHGSLHYTSAENVTVTVSGGEVEVCGTVRQSGLFGENLCLCRHYMVNRNGIEARDTVCNDAYTEANYVLLYHTNFGYPFLDENVALDIPFASSEGLTPFAKSRADKQLTITEPVDGGNEEVFYNYLDKGEVTITNAELNIRVKINYDVKDFPVLLQWKSMISGDYALGIEPAVTRFDEFVTRSLKVGERKEYVIKYDFSPVTGNEK